MLTSVLLGNDSSGKYNLCIYIYIYRLFFSFLCINMHAHACVHVNARTHKHMCMHTLYYIALHCTTSNYIAVLSITLHCMTFTFTCASHYIALLIYIYIYTYTHISMYTDMRKWILCPGLANMGVLPGKHIQAKADDISQQVASFGAGIVCVRVICYWAASAQPPALQE